MRQHFVCSLAFVLCLVSGTFAQPKPKEVRVKIDGVAREALVFAPTKTEAGGAPLVFAFHGHGGTAAKASDIFHFQKLWPEAIVVYMQGIPIESITDPEGKKAGWQHDVGQVGDRDLKFFDAMFARVKKEFKVDEGRVFAAGHSNGGGFTYLLWAARGDKFAAFAPSSASSANRYLKELKPKPVLHVAGRKDETAPFEKQEKLVNSLRTLDGCGTEGKKWHKSGTIYSSENGTPLVEVFHPGGHEFLSEAPRLMVTFFKEFPPKK